MKEIWKDIPNYEGYQVSNMGRVRTYNKITYTKIHGERHWKNRILKYKGQTYKTGYRVDLWKNGKRKTFLVARLVAFTFYEKDINDKSLTVDHIDGNRFNNKLDNLDLVSLRENIQRAFKNGLHNSHMFKIKIQYKDCAKPIYCNSMNEASRLLGCNKGYISGRIKKNKYENKYAMWQTVE